MYVSYIILCCRFYDSIKYRRCVCRFMDIEETLQKIGFSAGESKVYLALLRLGSAPVNKIKEKTNLHRTTIYDFLEKLINKSLVNYVVKNNVKYYKVTDPKKLLDHVKEKEEQVKLILPSLLQLRAFQTDDLIVEVFKGVEGIKTIFNDILRVGKDYVIFGVDEAMFKEKMGTYMDQFFMKEKQLGFKERILTSEAATYVYSYETAIYRYLPKESFSPTVTYVYANNVAILVWEPFSIIRIQNAALADAYEKYFEILWKHAKKKSLIFYKIN